MKKLSILVALILCVTIGGVYANWVYSGSEITSQTEPFVNKMGDLNYSGSSGSYTFSNNSIEFAIEPDNQIDKNTTLVWGTGSATLTFTKADDITSADLARALNATITVVSRNGKYGTYDSQQIYTVASDKSIQLTAEDWTHVDGTNVYTYVIKATDLQDFISVASFHLKTADQYAAFKSAHAEAQFNLKVDPAAAVAVH